MPQSVGCSTAMSSLPLLSRVGSCFSVEIASAHWKTIIRSPRYSMLMLSLLNWLKELDKDFPVSN
jgi:hypothetical protein